MNKLAKLIAILKKQKLTLAIAESCSGGYASDLLTQKAGSSKVFKGGLVVYSLEAKNEFFRIPFSILKKTQGVSKEIAATLAIKVRKKLDSDIGSSIVGFAGPVAPKGKKGTVLIAISDKASTVLIETIIKGKREVVRKKASQLLIELLYTKLR